MWGLCQFSIASSVLHTTHQTLHPPRSPHTFTPNHRAPNPLFESPSPWAPCPISSVPKTTDPGSWPWLKAPTFPLRCLQRLSLLTVEPLRGPDFLWSSLCSDFLFSSLQLQALWAPAERRPVDLRCLPAYVRLYLQFKRLLLDFTEWFRLCPLCPSHMHLHTLPSHPRVLCTDLNTCCFLPPGPWRCVLSSPEASLCCKTYHSRMIFAKWTQRSATKGQGVPLISFSEEIWSRRYEGCQDTRWFPSYLLYPHVCFSNRLWNRSKFCHLNDRSVSILFVYLATWACCFWRRPPWRVLSGYERKVKSGGGW